MPRTTVDAVYEDGVLRLSRPIKLADGTPVEVIVIPRPRPPASGRTPSEILDELAAMPVEAGDRTLHGRDHDRVLYGR